MLRRHHPVFVVAASALAVLIGQTASAHPLGNDSITHFSVLYVQPDQFRVDLVLDIAETPSQIIRRDEIDTNHDDNDTVQEQTAWLDKKAQEFAPLLHAKLDQDPMPLQPLKEVYDPKTGQKAAASRMILKMSGFGGMPTYRVLIGYGSKYPRPLAGQPHIVFFSDETFATLPGMRRILLEETTIATTSGLKFNELRAGRVPRLLADLCAKNQIELSPGATLKRAASSLFLLEDSGLCIAIEDTDTGLGLYRSPYISVELPRPSYWNEGLDPFNYQQYDPSELPQEKSAMVRFSLKSPCPAAPTTASAPASAPAVLADSTPSGPASRPAAGPLPAFITNLNAPTNNPDRTNASYRQADTLVGKLQEFRKGGGLLLFLGITFLAFSWGAGHALMPGHAKTVVAAYLISQRGTYWHAVLLALIVTITHTALVVVVGLIIYFYQKTHPTLGPKIQLWLGIVAGILVAIMGLTLIWRAVTGRIVHHHHDHDHDHAEHQSWWRRLFTHSHTHVHASSLDHDHEHHHHHDHGHPHEHHHDHDHAHNHGHTHTHVDANGKTHSHTHDRDHGHTHDHGHEHSHGHTAHTHTPSPTKPVRSASEPISGRMLLILGITGGIVPCPTAMIILLLGIGANVVAWALYAVGVFSLGLAITLMGIGFFALASRRFATKLLSDAEHEDELSTTGQRVMFQIIPALSGSVVVVLGCLIAANYLYTLQVGRPLISWLG